MGVGHWQLGVTLFLQVPGAPTTRHFGKWVRGFNRVPRFVGGKKRARYASHGQKAT